VQGRQGMEGTGVLSSRCSSRVNTCGVACMWEGAARWSTQLRKGCYVATDLSRWMGCSDPQGSGRGRERTNPAKMKLCPGSHNPFASSKLYKLVAVSFAFGWWLIRDSWNPICRDVTMLPSNFFVR